MSDTHSETATPRSWERRGAPGSRPARTVQRLVTAIALMGVLFLGAAVLAGFA